MGDRMQLNVYDYIGFPNREERDAVQKDYNIENLWLIMIDQKDISILSDVYIKRYFSWSTCIYHYVVRMKINFLLMHYQYIRHPSDFFSCKCNDPERCIYKIHFDTFAESTSVYFISYIDKLLSMLKELYEIKVINKKGCEIKRPNRYKIINEMKTRSNLKTIADEFNNVVEAEEFKDIKNIRDDFVHNKSGSHTGMATKKDKDEVVFSYYAEGISTEKTYQSMLSLIKLYEPLCKKLNEFFKREIVTYM